MLLSLQEINQLIARRLSPLVETLSSHGASLVVSIQFMPLSLLPDGQQKIVYSVAESGFKD